MNIKKIIIINYLISSGQARTPSGMSKRLGVSERTVFTILSFMKHELNAPIKYDRSNMRYYYAKKGRLNFEWTVDE